MFITNDNLQGSETLCIKNLLARYTTDYIIIPNNYQRDYSWSNKRKKEDKSSLEVFLDDFYTGMNATDPEVNFVLGNDVCLTNSKRKHYSDLADGQQRCTTIFILGLYLIKDIQNDKIREDYLKDFKNYHGLKLQQSIKEWDIKFEKTLLREDEDDNYIIPIKIAQQQIENFINKHIEEYDPVKWLEYLLKSVYVNVLIIPESVEEEYFNDVNTKGVKLSKFDIIKSTVINKCTNKGEIKWQKLISLINDLSQTTYTNRSSLTIEETILSWILYSLNLSDKVSTKNIYEIINNCDNGDLIIDSGIEIVTKAIEVFSDNNFSNMDPLQYMNGGMFIPCYFKLKYSTNLTDSEIVNGLIWTFININAGNKTDTAKIFRFINNKNLPLLDYNLLEDPRLIYKPRGRNVYVKTVLLLLDSYLSENNNFEVPKNISIEHIRSQQYDGDNKLGNLTLLSKSENSKLNAKQEKAKVYEDSQYTITRALLSNYKPINNDIRVKRNLYIMGITSEQLDVFDDNMIKKRGRNLLSMVYDILDIENIQNKLEHEINKE